MSDCIFCKIVNGEIPTDLIYEDEKVIAFKDINPQAPIHILLITKKHLATLNDLSEEDQALVGHLNLTAAKLAGELGIAESGYRLVNNCNRNGGQVVFHLHYHLLGGEKLGTFW